MIAWPLSLAGRLTRGWGRHTQRAFRREFAPRGKQKSLRISGSMQPKAELKANRPTQSQLTFLAGQYWGCLPMFPGTLVN